MARLKLTECPHCLTHVLPGRDGLCPSCHESTADAPLNPMTKLRVGADTPVVDMCCTCARQTDERETITLRAAVGPTGFMRFLWMVLVTIFFFKAWRAFTQGERGRTPALEAHVGRCRECRRRGELIPEHVNRETDKVTLLVRREYRDLVEQRAKKARAPREARS